MTPAFDITFTEEGHTYTLNGKPVPSVTTVLESVLESMSGIPRHLVEAAGDFGNHVHLACELYDLGELDEGTLDPNLAPYLEGYKRFLRDKQPDWTFIEARVGSVRYGYAGTVDRAGTIGKTKWQIDLKSSGAMPKTVGPQTAAYNQALEETYDWKARKRGCLLLKPNDYVLTQLTDMGDWSLYLSCLNIHKWKEKHHART